MVVRTCENTFCGVIYSREAGDIMLRMNLAEYADYLEHRHIELPDNLSCLKVLERQR